MGRFDQLALAIAAVATAIEAMGIHGFATRYYLDQVPNGKMPIGAAGWAIATYGPIGVAVLFWHGGKRVPAPWSWMLHILFIPCAWGLFVAGESMMLSVIRDPDFDAVMGGPEFVPALSLFPVVGSYLAAVIIRHMSRVRGRMNGG
jgi:hypothetical protein